MPEKTFTEALSSLQKAADAISRQTTSLEESIRLFEEGMKEAEYCSKILEEAAQKIELYGKEED